MSSGRSSYEAGIFRGQPQSFSVEELPPPACGDLPITNQCIEGQLAFHGLCLQMLVKLGEAREGIVFGVVGEAQARMQGMDLEAPLLQAKPLPASMNSFDIQSMVRCREEPRS